MDAAIEEPAPEESQQEWMSLDWKVKRLFSFSSEYSARAPVRLPAKPAGPYQDNFPKGAQWSPDGACLLTCAEDSVFRVYDLPPDAMACEPSAAATEASDSFWPGLRVKEGEAVYDYCWFPRMSAADPASCVFASTSRAHPLHLWGAVDGSLRCTYRAFDAADEITAALSVAFSADGASLIAGYNKEIRVFRTERPGRDCVTLRTLNKRNRLGQAGLVGALACNPWHRNLLAAGCYDRSVGIYDFTSREQLFILRGHAGGVTCVRFSPDGNFLYSCARKDDAILCWDVRSTEGPLYSIPRHGQTNQRLGFEIEPCGRTLVTGGTDGIVRAFALADGSEVENFQASQDAVNGVSVHPSAPLIAVAAGCRKFHDPDEEEERRPPNAASGVCAVQSGVETGAADATSQSGVAIWRCGFQPAAAAASAGGG